jgi:hypothetical protein
MERTPRRNGTDAEGEFRGLPEGVPGTSSADTMKAPVKAGRE